jgi:hypothetical protein
MASMKSTAFLAITPCSSDRVQWLCLLHASTGLLFGSFFNPEDGGDIFLRKHHALLTTWHYNREDHTLLSSLAYDLASADKASSSHMSSILA